jgi:membrane protease YdiL (CAAX protease family)
MKNLSRLGWFLFFLACGLLVFVIFSHYAPLFKQPTDSIGRVVTALGFLLAALLARRSERLKGYWLIPFAFFTALAAISLDYYLGLSKWILPALGIIEKSPAGWAIDKLESSLLGISVVLVLNRLGGQKAEALYIRGGNLRLGLIVGFVAFAVMVASVIPVTEWFFKGEDLSWRRILPWMPWVLIMVLANASSEELIFRGLLIGKIEPYLGKFTTNLVTTIPFVLMHAYTNYSPDTFIFLALQVLPLSLAWCWLMQKTNSIWGSILFHAAMDIPVFVGIFSNL